MAQSDFCFVHAADLHLDSPFEGIHKVNPDFAKDLKKATFKAFDRIIQLCIERQADFLLTAGDNYDGTDRSLQAQLRFRDGLVQLAEHGIPSFIVHGNHDPLSEWLTTLNWPDEVHIFRGSDVESWPVLKNGEEVAKVYGISHTSRNIRENLAMRFPLDSISPFGIGLLHCNVGTDTGHEPYAPCKLEDLTRGKINYWALGHVHKHGILHSAFPAIVYSGNPQGRNPRETGPRGCYVVTVHADGYVEPEFVAMDTIRWFIEDVPISGLLTEDDLVAALHNKCDEVRSISDNRSAVVRLRLTGRSSLHRTLMKPGFIEEELLPHFQEEEATYLPFIWVESIRISSLPELDLELRRTSEDFLGDFLRLVQEVRQDPARQTELKSALELLFNSPRGRRYLGHLVEMHLMEWLDAAEVYGTELLLGEGE